MSKETNLPQVSFSTFIMSLHSSSLLHLGIINDPVTNKKIKNIDMAKQTIELLAMLEEKTKNNLTDEEKKLLKHALHDTRMIFVKEKS